MHALVVHLQTYKISRKRESHLRDIYVVLTVIGDRVAPALGRGEGDPVTFLLRGRDLVSLRVPDSHASDAAIDDRARCAAAGADLGLGQSAVFP